MDKRLRTQLKINRRILEKLFTHLEVLMLTMKYTMEESVEKIVSQINDCVYANKEGPNILDYQESAQQLLLGI